MEGPSKPFPALEVSRAGTETCPAIINPIHGHLDMRPLAL
jgi:hypothetical protein